MSRLGEVSLLLARLYDHHAASVELIKKLTVACGAFGTDPALRCRVDRWVAEATVAINELADDLGATTLILESLDSECERAAYIAQRDQRMARLDEGLRLLRETCREVPS